MTPLLMRLAGSCPHFSVAHRPLLPCHVHAVEEKAQAWASMIICSSGSPNDD